MLRRGREDNAPLCRPRTLLLDGCEEVPTALLSGGGDLSIVSYHQSKTLCSTRPIRVYSDKPKEANRSFILRVVAVSVHQADNQHRKHFRHPVFPSVPMLVPLYRLFSLLHPNKI